MEYHANEKNLYSVMVVSFVLTSAATRTSTLNHVMEMPINFKTNAWLHKTISASGVNVLRTGVYHHGDTFLDVIISLPYSITP